MVFSGENAKRCMVIFGNTFRVTPKKVYFPSERGVIRSADNGNS